MLLSDCFDFQTKEVVSIVGSGGKTTLMNYLTKAFRSQRVLMTTTTKIRIPEAADYDYRLTPGFLPETVQPGISLIGQPVPSKMGRKLGSVPLSELADLIPCFDKTFNEADGAKTRLLKAWRPGEPVILEETTCTIGVVPLNTIGRRIDDETVHRLPKFLEFGPFHKDQLIDLNVLAAVISHPEGIFAQALGRRILVLNHADTALALENAKQLVAGLDPSFLRSMDRIIAANTLQQWGQVLWQKV